MKVDREKFLQALESVQPGVSTKEIIEQSGCFIFKAGEVLTFDDEVGCRAKSGLEKTFKGAVQALPLMNILKKIPDDSIELEQKGDEFLIVGKRKKAGVRMEAEILLSFEQLEKPETWTALHEDFLDGLALVQECAGTDESQFKLTCVHIHPKWLEATDGFQMIRWRMATGITEKVLVRNSSIKHIVGLGVTELSETPSWIHFKSPSGLILSCRKFLEDFIELGPLFKFTGEPTTLPKGLEEAAERAEVFSAEVQDNNVVLVELSVGKLKIRGQGTSGWYEETKKLPYKGQSMAFLIAPKLLAQLANRFNSCEVTPERLKVNGGNWKYVTVLGIPNSNGHTESNGEME